MINGPPQVERMGCEVGIRSKPGKPVISESPSQRKRTIPGFPRKEPAGNSLTAVNYGPSLHTAS